MDIFLDPNSDIIDTYIFELYLIRISVLLNFNTGSAGNKINIDLSW